MKYTKGDWKVNKLGKSQSNCYQDFTLIVKSSPTVIALCDREGWTGHEERLANAHLISAAPDQNRALSEIDHWLNANPNISNDPQLHIIHIHIQNALAKAEGKSG